MQGAPFQTVAGQFSQSPSAADGGDIGWVIQGQLRTNSIMPFSRYGRDRLPGQSAPRAGYYILLLRDRREPSGANPAEAQSHSSGGPQRALAPRQVLDPSAGKS